jgi:hypothetical protein
VFRPKPAQARDQGQDQDDQDQHYQEQQSRDGDAIERLNIPPAEQREEARRAGRRLVQFGFRSQGVDEDRVGYSMGECIRMTDTLCSCASKAPCPGALLLWHPNRTDNATASLTQLAPARPIYECLLCSRRSSRSIACTSLLADTNPSHLYVYPIDKTHSRRPAFALMPPSDTPLFAPRRPGSTRPSRDPR